MRLPNCPRADRVSASARISSSLTAPEGRQLNRLHRIRERDGALRRSKVKSVLKTIGRLDWEGCGFNFRDRYGDYAGDYIEVHHLTPLAELPARNTSLADFALVCANCHRMIHRCAEWLSLDDLKAILPSGMTAE
jgi:5-methylcytosine-specific restriction protein A